MICKYCENTFNGSQPLCATCTNIKGALPLKSFEIHAYLAFQDGVYTFEQMQAVGRNIKFYRHIDRLKSTKKAAITRQANETGWREYYRDLRLKVKGKAPSKYPNPTKTAGIREFICNVISWSGGYASGISNEGLLRKDRSGNYHRHFGYNNGIADIDAGFNGRAIKIEIKNRFTGDKWKEDSAQAAYRNKVVAAGAIHFIATDIEQFLDWWKKLTITQLKLF